MVKGKNTGCLHSNLIVTSHCVTLARYLPALYPTRETNSTCLI
ncbi:unnamed protein product, partial [Gulo gulo]